MRQALPGGGTLASSTRFWRQTWVTGLAAGLAGVAFALSPAGRSLDHVLYDLGQRLGARSVTARGVAVVAIDAATLSRLGPRPWDAGVYAALLERLRAAGVAAVGLMEPPTELTPGPAARRLARLRTELDPRALARSSRTLRRLERLLAEPLPQAPPAVSARLARARTLLRQGGLADALPRRLQRLAQLAATVPPSGGAALRAAMHPPPPVVVAARPGDRQPSAAMLRHALADVSGRRPPPPGAPGLAPLPDAVAEAAAGVAPVPDDWRAVPLVMRTGAGYFPTLPAALAAAARGLAPASLGVRLGEAVRIGALRVPVDDGGRFLPRWPRPQTVAVVPMHRVLDRTPPTLLRGRAVVVGATAPGTAAVADSPVGPMPAVMAAAATTAALLEGRWLERPPRAEVLERGLLLFALLLAVSVLPRLGPVAGWVATVVLVNLLLDAALLLAVTGNLSLRLAGPATVLLVAQATLSLRRLAVGHGRRWVSEVDWSETNRALALALQAQGQLDGAFERLRRCRPDEATREALYSLALDYERRRHYAKARTVYEHLDATAPGYRDVAERIARTRQMESAHGLALSGPGARGDGLGIAGEGLQKPMLGRYVVEEVIGKGAMGTVYKGRDPRINRVVAIKTLALSREFAEDELEEVKRRFFREAETAGRLNHPNIVTIYDAGEDQDLAYIAMEYLEGRDLTAFTRPKRLLPPAVALHIVIKAAEALDYAHRRHVVHRDIKPGNIVFEPRTGLVKLTDFGIARITDASRTRTGMVLGTPAYMSPEQLAGTKVDGRSDLFSLGVMLYQLLTGRLPFEADSMTSLMYKITHEPHRPPSRLNPKLPPCIDEVLARALAKEREARFQSGAEFARALRGCGRRALAARAAVAPHRGMG